MHISQQSTFEMQRQPPRGSSSDSCPVSPRRTRRRSGIHRSTRDMVSLVEVYGSDHRREFVERCGKVQSAKRVDPKFGVSSPQVPNDGMQV